jgi:hypothetical protein
MASKFRVLYDFKAEEEGELSVKENDAVTDHSQFLQDSAPDGWIFVKASNNSIGFVPRTYISPLEQDTNKKFATQQSSSQFNTPAGHTKLDNKTASSSQYCELDLYNGINSAHDEINGPMSSSQVNGITSKIFPLKSTTISNKFEKLNLNLQPPESPIDETFDYSQSVLDRMPSSTNKAIKVAVGGSTMSMANLAKVISQSQSMISKTTYVNNMMKVPSAAIPHFASYAERAEFDDLSKETDKFLEKQIIGYAENGSSLRKNLEDITGLTKTMLANQEDLIVNMQMLHDILENEKKKLKQSTDAERDFHVINRKVDM